MTVLQLLVALVATGVVVWLSPRAPAPWPMVIYAVLIVLWVVALVYILGLDARVV